MSSSSNSKQHDPQKDSWYPYSNGTKHFDGNIAMILIFIFCALVCALAINTAIRFILRHSRAASTSASATQQQQQQQQQQHDDDYDKKPSISTQSLLPTLVFSSGTKMKLAGVGADADAAAECAICLSEFVQGEGVRILPKCKHGFHVKCIEGWLSAHVSCPTCRSTCLPSSPPHNYDVESQSSPN